MEWYHILLIVLASGSVGGFFVALIAANGEKGSRDEQ